MRITLLTNEYPPHVYGGAGVHIEYLARELAAADEGRHDVNVLCFGDQSSATGNLKVRGIEAPVRIEASDDRHVRFFDTALRNLVMAATPGTTDIVHCHTWYSHLAGCLVQQLAEVPLVLTTHSLEPHRPWKAEQLGTAYNASTWVERTAYQNADGVIAVSKAMERDVADLYGVAPDRIRVIHNGIDLDEYRPTPSPETLTRLGIDPDTPYVLFVGRITRQKGIVHLVNAIRHFTTGVQIVLCAGAPDTAAIAVYTHAAVFVCPSVYEPFGIINLEAMACHTPVVASAVGGIPEVVDDGTTGLLVPITPRSATDVEPRDPERFARDLAAAVNTLLADPDRRERMAAEARVRVEREFSWQSVARRTLDYYGELVESRKGTHV